GARKFKDLSGDGKISTDANSKDKAIIGNALPDWTGGLIISGWIGNFDYSANFNAVFGNEIYNANLVEFTSTRKYNYRNLLNTMTVENRWTNVDWTTGELVNDPDKLAEMNAGKTEGSPMIYNAAFSDAAVEDGSFVRLASVTLGYTFPEKLTKRVGIQNLRVYATGSNLFLWTNYSGYDPEVDSRRSTPLTPGVDYSAYPKSRGVVFGLNLTF
ncbi:MAG: SusC/RagA family protein, partial [Tidjanibacter sp.]|nr:SusC/RagA family protein [Tidjanibacter sp.]